MVLSSSGSGFRNIKRAKATYGRSRGSSVRTSSSLTPLPSTDSEDFLSSSSESDSDDGGNGKRQVESGRLTKGTTTVTKSVARKPLGEKSSAAINIRPGPYGSTSTSRAPSSSLISSEGAQKPIKCPVDSRRTAFAASRKGLPPPSSPLSSPPPRSSSSSSSSRRSALAAKRRLKVILCSDSEAEQLPSSSIPGGKGESRLAVDAISLPSSSEDEDALAVERSLANLAINERSFSGLHGSDGSDRDLELDSLLSLCDQDCPSKFSEAFDDFLDETGDKTKLIVETAGQASYSFVFRMTAPTLKQSSILKVIPLRRMQATNSVLGDVGTSQCSDVRREISITTSLGRSEALRRSFVRLIGSQVVRGVLPKELTTSLEKNASSQGQGQRTSSVDEDSEKADSSKSGAPLYALLHLEDAGVDLESFDLQSFGEAAEITAQVVEAIAQAEKDHTFEHRDLHWGNILVRRRSSTQHAASEKQSKHTVSSWQQLCNPAIAKLQSTIIDFTLSRIGEDDDLYWFDLASEPELFSGDASVDEQFEVYRSMRSLLLQHSSRALGASMSTSEHEEEPASWSEKFDPRTNVLWIHYLVRKLLYSKNLDAGADETGQVELLHKRRLLDLESLLQTAIVTYWSQDATKVQKSSSFRSTGPQRKARQGQGRTRAPSKTGGDSVVTIESSADLREWLKKEWQ